MEATSDFRRRALPDRLAPTEVERRALAARVEEIDLWLAPSPKNAIIRAVGLVRGLMASASTGDVNTVLDGYATILGPFPQPVVEDVCTRFLDGRLGNRVYAPTPAEIAHECRQRVADAHAERARIRLILDAEVYSTPSPEEQAKIQAEYLRFVAETAERAERGKKDPTLEPAGTQNADRQAALDDLKRREERRLAEEEKA